jgi:hypothetical protein
VASILWRRIDAPGHDACRLERTAEGWALRGAAAFAEKGTPAQLAYSLSCDLAWRSRRGDVKGAVGERPVAFTVAHEDDGRWTLGGETVPGLDGCLDLDLGFTPATNLFQLRRCALAVGDAADVPVAWLDVWKGTLSRLDQRYERRGSTSYWYEAPRFGYQALLEVDADAFIREYPGLWSAEP